MDHTQMLCLFPTLGMHSPGRTLRSNALEGSLLLISRASVVVFV